MYDKEEKKRDFIGMFLAKIRNEDEEGFKRAHSLDNKETKTQTEKKEEN